MAYASPIRKQAVSPTLSDLLTSRCHTVYRGINHITASTMMLVMMMDSNLLNDVPFPWSVTSADYLNLTRARELFSGINNECSASVVLTA